MNNIEIFVAREKMLFGIRKGDEIEYDNSKKTTVLKRTGAVLPFDAKKEVAFFEYIPKPQSTYQINDIVHLTSNQKLEIVGGKGYRTANRYYKMQAYLSMKIVDVRINPGQSPRRKKLDYHYITEVGDYQYRVDLKEPHLQLTEHYWFISSSGKISSAIINKDAVVEKFRKKMNNYFTSLKDAQTAFKKL